MGCLLQEFEGMLCVQELEQLGVALKGRMTVSRQKSQDKEGAALKPELCVTGLTGDPGRFLLMMMIGQRQTQSLRGFVREKRDSEGTEPLRFSDSLITQRLCQMMPSFPRCSRRCVQLCSTGMRLRSSTMVL